MRLILLIAVILITGLRSAHSQTPTPEPVIHASLCEIKAHPENFLRKLVEFNAIASHGFEDSMLEDNHCKWPEGGPGVWMEYGGTRSTGTMYCCGFSPKSTRDEVLVIDGVSLPLIDDENFRLFDSRLHPKHSKPQPSSDTAEATVRGRIFGRYEGIGGTLQGLAWRGYGHMGCCMLFVVTQVVSVNAPK